MRKLITLEFTPLEFETASTSQSDAAQQSALEFTPLEFETTSKFD